MIDETVASPQVGSEKRPRAKNFIKSNYGYIVSAVFVFAVYFAAQAYFDIWPFGKAIMASYDQLAQVCPFLEHYLSVIDGSSGLFHTFFTGGGMDVFGILAYCTVSPFSFIFLLGGRGNSLYLVSVVLPIKTACVAWSALWFTKRHFPTIPHYLATAAAIVYSFCGYLFVANTYINWVDLLIYMPLVASGFIRLATGGKIKMLSVSLALLVYTCFSIASFSFFTLYPIGIAYFLICKKGDERKKLAARFSLAFVLAVAMSLPLLLPALSAYMRAGRNTGIFSRVFSASVNDPKHLYAKFTYILCDSSFIFLTVVYFIRKSTKEKFALFLYTAFALALLPCLIDESMLLLNAGSYYSYALRFGFISSFLFFYTAMRCLADLTVKEEQKPRYKPINYIIAIVVTILVAAGVAATFFLMDFILKGKFESGQPFYSFFPAFAHSEGGLEGTAILFGVVSVVCTLAALAVFFKLAKARDVIAVICILSLSQAAFFGAAEVKGDRQGGSAENYGYHESLIAQIKENDDGYFRLKGYDYYISADSPIIMRSYAYTVFDSTADAKNLTPPAFFKYGGNGTNSARSNRGTMFSDALLSYKYVVYKTSDEGNAKRSYLEKKDYKASNYIIYENTLAFPQAAVVDGDKMIFDGLGYVGQVDSIFSFLNGGESGMTDLTPTFTANDDGTVKVTFKAPARSDYYWWQDFPSELSVVKVDGEKRSALAEYNSYGYTENGTTRTVVLGAENGALTAEDAQAHFHASAIEMTSVSALRDKLRSSEVKFELRPNEIYFPEKIVATKGQKMFLSFANIDGYVVKVNGKTVDLEDNGMDFMIFALDEGENTVEITYRSPYIKLIIFGLVAGVLIVLFAILIYRRKPFIFAKCEKPLFVMSIVLASALVLFFFVFPTGLYAVKAFRFLFA